MDYHKDPFLYICDMVLRFSKLIFWCLEHHKSNTIKIHLSYSQYLQALANDIKAICMVYHT